MSQKRFLNDFTAFFRDLYVVEGAYGPKPLLPPFLESWLRLAFPAPEGHPAARNIADFRCKKQGKSGLAGAVALYMAARQEYSEVVIVAADRDQAKDRVLRSVKYAIERGPLAVHAKVYKDVIELDNHSIIQAMPNDWQGAAGGNYAAVIFDELHAWVYESNRRVFDEMVIPPTAPHGCRWIASYAGYEGESLLLKEWWDRALQGEKVEPGLPIYHNQAASLLAFVDVGPESWRMPWMTAEYIKEIQETERPNTFRRIWLNEWVSSESQFLPEGAWEECYSSQVKPLGKGDHVRLVYGADASTTRDLTSLVGSFWNRDSQTVDVRYCRIWKPQRGILRRGKPTIDLADTIGAEVIRLHAAGLLDAVVCDPYQLHTLIISWEKMGIRVVELPQTSGRVESDQGLYDAVIGKAIRHYNDPDLNEHIRNAVALETARGLRLAKEKTSQKIDAAVALSMSHHGALTLQKAIGEAGWVVDPFDDWPPADDDVYDPQYGWMDAETAKRTRHPPGVTWHNCRYRNAGCLACMRELEAEGWYENQERERVASYHMAKNRRDEVTMRQAEIVTPEQEKQNQARRAVQIRMNQIRKNIRGE